MRRVVQAVFLARRRTTCSFDEKTRAVLVLDAFPLRVTPTCVRTVSDDDSLDPPSTITFDYFKEHKMINEKVIQ